MKHLLYLLLFISSIPINGQIEESGDAIFKVEFEKFKPSNKDQIREFEGKAPMPFQAPDIEGNQQDLRENVGKTVFIYFFNRACGMCGDQVSAFNLLQEEYGDEVKIIAIGDGTKEEMIEYKAEHGIAYPVLYQGRLLGEAAFGIEMGYPRLFVVDSEGITRHVLPEEAFDDASKTYVILDNLFKLVNAK